MHSSSRPPHVPQCLSGRHLYVGAALHAMHPQLGQLLPICQCGSLPAPVLNAACVRASCCWLPSTMLQACDSCLPGREPRPYKLDKAPATKRGPPGPDQAAARPAPGVQPAQPKTPAGDALALALTQQAVRGGSVTVALLPSWQMLNWWLAGGAAQQMCSLHARHVLVLLLSLLSPS